MELIWIGTAFICGLIATRFYFPPLVGYLAAGYLLHALNIQPLESLGRLAEIGIELLLFSVGLKMKPSSLVRREVLMVGGMHLLLMTAFAAFVFLLFYRQVTGGLLLGISLAFSSTVLAVKVLEDSGELSLFHGRDVMGILILQDIVAIGLLAYIEGNEPTPWMLLIFLIPFFRPLAHRLLSICHSSELKLLLGVSFALAGGALSESVGVAADIGALLTGIMLAEHIKTDELADKLWSLKELFLVAFFLQIGLTDLPTAEQVYYALGLMALLPIQWVMFFGLFIISGLRARTAFVSSLALTTYSEFALITTIAMVNNHLLSEKWLSIISLAVAGSLAIAAPLNRISHRLFVKVEPWLINAERKSKHPDDLPNTFGSAEWLVVGMGRTGTSTYQSLSDKKQRVVGIDGDPTVIDNLLANGLTVVYADTEDNELWNKVSLKKIKGIVLTMPSFDSRIKTIDQIRSQGFQGIISTICYHNEKEPKLISHGANFVIHPLVEAGNQLATQMLEN